jgi:ferredoxin
LFDLVHALNEGAVSDLVILESNPVYATPRDARFNEAIRKAEFRVHLGSYFDETARVCHWHIPLAHELESWGDVKAFDGTVTVRQPLIKPLREARTEYEVAEIFAENQNAPYPEVIRDFWKRKLNPYFWNKAVHDGVISGTASTPIDVIPQGFSHWDSPAGILPQGFPSVKQRNISMTIKPSEEKLTLLIRPDPYIGGGEFANNARLQELPKPFTQLTWENALLMSPKTAKSFNVVNGDIMKITPTPPTTEGSLCGTAEGDRMESQWESPCGRVVGVEAPVCIVSGQANGVLTIHLGYGRTHAGSVGSELGFNAYPLMTMAEPFRTRNFTIQKTEKWTPLVITQNEQILDGKRKFLFVSDLDHFKKNPDFVRKKTRPPEKDETLYGPSEHLNDDVQWGMCIDLNRCTGCGACTMACQVENNIPTVGKNGILRHRQMHWIRVDRYYAGPLDHPAILHQPVPCMHCETAPCELVCPVEARATAPTG